MRSFIFHKRNSCFIEASQSSVHKFHQQVKSEIVHRKMDQLLQEQHAQEGTDNLSLDQLKKAIGGILSFLKSKLGDSFDFSKITSAIPEADTLVADAETEHSRAGPATATDLMNSAMSMFGGGNEAAAPAPAADGAPVTPAPVDNMAQLLGFLTKAGIDPNQIMQFLPVVSKFLKDNAGVDVSSALGVPATGAPAPAVEGGEAAAPAPAAAADDNAKEMVENLMGQASGFMNKFK